MSSGDPLEQEFQMEKFSKSIFAISELEHFRHPGSQTDTVQDRLSRRGCTGLQEGRDLSEVL